MSSMYNDASLALIPSAVGDGVVYSASPTDGAGDFDFTRASEATRVLSGGRIEKVRTNSILRSQEFDNASWGALGTITVTADNTTSPLGDMTADKVLGLDASSAINQIVSGTSGVLYTNSLYIKNVDATSSILLIRNTSNAIDATLNWSGSVLSSVTNSTGTTTFTDEGDGWYRLTSTYISVESIQRPRLYPATGTGNTSVYLWGAQLEDGLVATEYIATTSTSVSVGSVNDMPRLDWSGGCPSLKLEPQRTNEITQSEYFGDSSWIKSSVTLDSGYAAPDGTNSAYKVTDGGSGSLYINSISGASHSRSIYARAVSGTGTVDLMSYYGNTNNTFTLTEEWQRFEVSSTTTSTGATNFYAVDFRGGGTLTELLIWGAQTEVGNYPTSIIPSYGTATTRAADACSKTGITSLIGQTEGVLFLDFEIQTTGQDMAVMNIYNASTPANSMYFYLNSSNVLVGYVDNSGTQATISTGVLAQGRYKAAMAYKANDCVFYLNGSLVGTDVSNTIPTCNALRLENYADVPTYQEKTEINQALLFTTRLSNTELEKLTTL